MYVLLLVQMINNLFILWCSYEFILRSSCKFVIQFVLIYIYVLLLVQMINNSFILWRSCKCILRSSSKFVIQFVLIYVCDFVGTNDK